MSIFEFCPQQIKFCLVFGGSCSWGLKGNLYNFLMGGECATRGWGSFETCIIVCFKQRIVSAVQLSGTYCSSPFRVSSLMLVRLCNIGNSFFRISFVSISFWGSKLERKNMSFTSSRVLSPVEVLNFFSGFVTQLVKLRSQLPLSCFIWFDVMAFNHC